MNILLVTELFPIDEKQNRIDQSYVMYSFVLNWMKDPNNNILVIVPREKKIRQELKELKKKLSPQELFKKYFSLFFPSRHDVKPFKFQEVVGMRVSVRKWWFRPYSADNIFHILKEYGYSPDVVVSHLPISGVLSAQISQKCRIPHIHGIHMTDYRFCKNFPFKRIYHTADALVYRSWSLQMHMHSIGIKSSKEAVIPSGVKENLFISRVHPKNFETPFHFLSVCALIERKNIDKTLIALSKLEAVEWTYTIIGSGPEEDGLKMIARRLGISEKVHFRGFQEHSICLQAMEEHDIFIMVSAPETLGMVYLEAMAKGMVVIGSYNNGVDGFVKDGENGFLCKPGDADVLYSKILDICQRKSLERIQKAALASVHSLTEEKACRHYFEFIKDVCTLNDQ